MISVIFLVRLDEYIMRLWSYYAIARLERECVKENRKVNRKFSREKDENGHLIIDEDQAIIVRRIFREYLQGASMPSMMSLQMRLMP